MDVQKVKLSELTPDPKNTRIHDSHNLEVIRNSLEKFGQYRPFVVQKEGMIIRVGNGMYQAMKDLGWKEGSCVVKDMTDEESVALSILDNKSSDLSVFNNELLAEALDFLDKDSLKLTGFLDTELNVIFSNLDTAIPEVVEEVKKPKEKPATNPMPIRQYQIIFESDEQYKKWIDFIDALKEKYGETIPECLLKFIAESNGGEGSDAD